MGQTGFGQGLLAQLGQQNNENIAQIPTNAAQSFIGMAPGVSSGATGQGTGAAGTAGGLNMNRSFSGQQAGASVGGSDFGDLISALFLGP